MNNERAELARLLPDPARHDLPGHRQQILRQRFMREIDEPRDVAAEAAPPARRRRRVLVGVLTASAVAVVVALGAVSAFGFGVGKFWAGQTQAGGLLDRIALAAANSTDIPPADQIRDDQFDYVETYGGFAGVSAASDRNGNSVFEPIPLKPHRRQIWKSVNGAQAGLLRDANVAPGDLNLGANGGASLNNPTFRYLTTLPTNPDVLLAKIYLDTWGAGPNPQQEAFVTIGDLMRESIVPADLAAALYKAAARIPGVTLVDDAVDALGRHGVAIARTDSGLRAEWIFDRHSLQFLGERSVTTEQTEFGPAGTITGSTAIVVRAIVDRPGQLPTD
jgi:hypothetical protein